jgi:D-tyrosyl-tRNA(Tyr) deacylase
MRALIQRVASASVTVQEKQVACIGPGLLILLGVGPGDDRSRAASLAEKIAHLRIFEDADGKVNLSLQEVNGEALVVSQFTLYADTRKGRRPSFTEAAAPEIAEPLVEAFADCLRELGITTCLGVFGAHMQVALINDGPVTIWLENDK